MSQLFASFFILKEEEVLFQVGGGCCLLGWWDVLRVASRCCVCHVGRAWLGFAEREVSWRELLPKSYRDNILL